MKDQLYFRVFTTNRSIWRSKMAKWFISKQPYSFHTLSQSSHVSVMAYDYTYLYCSKFSPDDKSNKHMHKSKRNVCSACVFVKNWKTIPLCTGRSFSRGFAARARGLRTPKRSEVFPSTAHQEKPLVRRVTKSKLRELIDSCKTSSDPVIALLIENYKSQQQHFTLQCGEH